MSIYRCVSLCESVPSQAVFPIGHLVQFDPDKGGGTLVVDRGSRTIWRDMHECAVASEWEVALDDVLVGSSPLVDRRGLSSKGPAGFLALPEPSDEDDELLPLFIRLRDRALPIVARRTVFVLPEDLTSSPLELEPLIEDWADQLYGLLSRGYISTYTFVRFGATGKTPGMLDLMIEHMHRKIAALAFGTEQDERQGPILLIGPTGTGKSYGMRLYAKKTWGLDKFVNVNLAAVTATTLESRVRGYVKGAFTGADAAGKASWFEEADGGTLFLDEFQSVSMEYQVQLLDLLSAVSDKVEIARMGADRQRKWFKVKVVLAINEDLGELLSEGRLRQDLLYRIRRIIRFQTLKERLADPTTNRAFLMTLLMSYRWRMAPWIEQSAGKRGSGRTLKDDLPAQLLHAMFSQFENGAIDALLHHDWPGNLRELERVASDLFYDADRRLDADIRVEHAQQAIAQFYAPRANDKSDSPSVSTLPESTAIILASVERALREHRFNIKDVIPGLKVYKLGSRYTLRRFLLNHRDLLSREVAADSKLKRFMKVAEDPG